VVNKINRLSSRTVATLKESGRHADGGCLYLKIGSSGAKSWIFMWARDGRQREAGLGSINAVTLARAREIATSWRAAIADGHDPIEARQAERAERKARKTFGDVVDSFLETKTEGLRNATQKAQWRRTLENYAKPIWRKQVDTIDTAAILEVLKPIWQSKPAQAAAVRGRIEAVLDAARVQGLRSGDNPARWKGNLDKLLPRTGKLTQGHHAAMRYQDVPALLTRLHEDESIDSLALGFLILTAMRTVEVLGARWEEIDLGAKAWTIPAARMKMNREHRVPLSPRAIEIIEKVAAIKSGPLLFPGRRLDRPLADNALKRKLKGMGIKDATVHGFRSSFRDWAGEETHFPREVCEAALAHVVGNAVEQAYRRGDALEKRRGLMDAWAAFLDGSSGANVVPLRKAPA
jgi:integrase